jgi:integrase
VRGILPERIVLSTMLDPYMPLKALAAYSGMSVRLLRDCLTDPAHPLPHYRHRGKIIVRRSEWIFLSATDPAKPLNDAWLRDRVWRPLLEKAEVRYIRVHDARHTNASPMLRRGVPPGYVSRQLGHSSIQVTVDLYGHFIPGADRDHVEGLAEAFAQAGSDATPAQPTPATTEEQPHK